MLYDSIQQIDNGLSDVTGRTVDSGDGYLELVLLEVGTIERAGPIMIDQPKLPNNQQWAELKKTGIAKAKKLGIKVTKKGQGEQDKQYWMQEEAQGRWSPRQDRSVLSAGDYLNDSPLGYADGATRLPVLTT